MNRRLIIYDDDPILNIDLGSLLGFGYTGSQEIYSSSQIVGDLKRSIPAMMEPDADHFFGTLGPGDGVLLVGPKAFPILQKWFHFGIRGENYYDCSRLRRLGTSGGFFVKTIFPETDLPMSQAVMDYFMSPQFAAVREFPEFNYRVVHTFTEALPFLQYFYGLQPGTPIGFDYEGSGLAFDKEYRITGASLATLDGNAVFFSFTDIQKNNGSSEWSEFNELFKNILIRHEKSLWVYNAGYEAQVSWRTFGEELNFPDASVVNYIQGLNSKRYSLKITAQRVLGGGTENAPYLKEQDQGGILPWDTAFDDLEDTLDRMFWETVKGKTKADTKKVPKCTLSDYQGTPEWAEICRRYPTYVPDFVDLISDPGNFGNPFVCIPAEILGKYCCLDSFYTVKLAAEALPAYDQVCIDTYLGNLSLGHKLTRGGLYINDQFRETYDSYCDDMMLYGITFAALYVTKLRLEKHRKKANKLSDYSDLCQLFLKRGEFYKGDCIEITKTLLAGNLDNNDFSDTGLNEGKIALTYGTEFAEWLVKIVKDSMSEIKFKGKIDASITRKKKLLGVVSEKLRIYLGIDKLNLGDKHIELEKYLYYQDGYNNLLQVNSQIPNPNQIPEYIFIGRKKYTKTDATKYIMEGFFRCTSPIDNDDLTRIFLKEFRNETIFLATIKKEKNKFPDEKKYYKNLGLDPSQAFEHFTVEKDRFYQNSDLDEQGNLIPRPGYRLVYHPDVFATAHKFESNPWCDEVKNIWGSWDGYDAQDDYFDVSGRWQELLIPYDEKIMFEADNFYRMRTLLIHILLYKKYSKIKTTYINGLFYSNSRYVIDTPSLMPLRDADPTEPGAIKKCFVKADVLLKETKRWSSGMHTIPSHMDSKACITCPSYIDPQTGKKTSTFLSYFDISSAEVRTLAYKSGDKNLIGLFESGKDVYIHTACAHLGKDKWDQLSKGDQKAYRKRFKVVFLAVAYRMSNITLGTSLNISPEEAQGLIDTLFGEFPVLKGFIEARTQYPENHDGLINTFLGDHLQCTDWRYRFKIDKRGKRVIDRAKIAKCQRAGINYSIQNYSAVALANGFNNVQLEARKQGILAKNVIVVHDSCENYVSMNHLFEILDFYMTYFMEFCYSLYGIRFMFDLEVGIDYGNMLSLTQPDPNTVTITGNGSTILEFIRRIEEESDLKVSYDVPLESIKPQFVEDAIERFISDRQCCMVKDVSKYTVNITKLS